MSANLGYMLGQVGVNTEDPKSTLDIVAGNKPNNPEGLLIPRVSAAQLNSLNSLYETAQNSALVYVTSGTGTAGTKTEHIQGEGFYYYDGPAGKWTKVNSTAVKNKIGDIKHSVAVSDHDGWVLLDGRAVSSLGTVQRTNAQSLGFSTNLPNAENSVLVQTTGVLGSTVGSNQRLITQANLPNVSLTPTTAPAGAHSHTYSPQSVTLDICGRINSATGARANGTMIRSTTSAGEHGHTYTLSLNPGTQTPLDLTPKSLRTNVFVYLGN